MEKNQKKELDFFNSLEKITSFNIWGIQEELIPSSKLISPRDEKVITERKALSYSLNEGQLLQNSQATDVFGSIISPKVFSDKEVQYLKERLQQTSNPILKARYAHILWNETKHNSYAEISIDSYLKLIRVLKPSELNELPNILAAILSLAKKTKRRMAEAKKTAILLLKELPKLAKGSILNVIIESGFFKEKELRELEVDPPNMIDLMDESWYSINKYNLGIILSLYTKLGNEPRMIYKLLAENEDLILRQHSDDTDFLKLTIVGQKAIYLKKAKEEKGYGEAIQEYERLKRSVKLTHHQYELSVEMTELFNDYLNKKSEIILQLSTDEILAFFAMNEDILVDPEANGEYSKKSIKNTIVSLFSQTVFDINANFRSLEESDKIDNEKVKNYSIQHSINGYSLLIKVFTDGILSGKLNYYKVFNFFKENTWYGIPFPKRMGKSDSDDQSSWLTLIAPGIHSLFSQFELSLLLNTDKVNNFILAIDSLTLKFEGALRGFIKLTGGNTTKLNKEGHLQEQLLEELLDNPKTKESFTIRDIGLFKYTFTKGGKNIRNIVAHSFMRFADYDLQKAFLIFLCILRLGKYTLEEAVV